MTRRPTLDLSLIAAAIALPLGGAAVVGLSAPAAVAGGTSPIVAAGAKVVGTRSNPGMVDCGYGPEDRRPSNVVLTCADAGIQLKDLKWATWGPSGATAKGTLTWNVCKPSCAASSKWDDSTASVTLANLRNAGKSWGWVYERMTVHITGAKTGGIQRTTIWPIKP